MKTGPKGQIGWLLKWIVMHIFKLGADKTIQLNVLANHPPPCTDAVSHGSSCEPWPSAIGQSRISMCILGVTCVKWAWAVTFHLDVECKPHASCDPHVALHGLSVKRFNTVMYKWVRAVWPTSHNTPAVRCACQTARALRSRMAYAARIWRARLARKTVPTLRSKHVHAASQLTETVWEILLNTT